MKCSSGRQNDALDVLENSISCLVSVLELPTLYQGSDNMVAKALKAYLLSILAGVVVFLIICYAGVVVLHYLMKVHVAFKFLGFIIFCAALYVSVNFGRTIFKKYKL